MAQILLIADEATCRSEFVSYLLRSGHEIECAHDAEAGLTASVRGAELVLLDIVDSAGGLSPLTLLREKTLVPVIVIGSSAETIDKVLALELGADDYVAKPFECLEIAARIQAVLRRVSRAHPNRPLRVGPLTLNSARCEVSLHQDKLHLKPIEFRILSYLMRMTGYVVSRDNLVRHVYGREVAGSDQRVAVHICHLRQKLETGDVFVKTIRGVGYQLCLKDKPSEE